MQRGLSTLDADRQLIMVTKPQPESEPGAAGITLAISQPGRSGLSPGHHAPGQHDRGRLVHREPAQLPVQATTQENAHSEGGTGLFVNAAGSFSSSVSPNGLLGRNPDGSCAVGEPLLYEVDMVAFTGTLSF
jgi:hypothetical protein